MQVSLSSCLQVLKVAAISMQECCILAVYYVTWSAGVFAITQLVTEFFPPLPNSFFCISCRTVKDQAGPA